MKLTVEHLDAISGHTILKPRKVALCRFMNTSAGTFTNVMAPHRLALFLAQIMHESGALKYVKEVWGPTAAQRRYEGRKDLGNVQKGDGKRFMGRDLIQVTGRANYASLTEWCRAFDPKCPDFEANPSELEHVDYLGLGAVWYWTERVPRQFVEAGDMEMITRRINGGLNGYADRLRYYDRAALVLLGYDPEAIRAFQHRCGLVVDGISGPATRAALHTELKRIPSDLTTPPPATEIEPQGLWAVLVAFLQNLLKGKDRG